MNAIIVVYGFVSLVSDFVSVLLLDSFSLIAETTDEPARTNQIVV